MAIEAGLSEGGVLSVKVGDRTCQFRTRTSEPDGKWAESAEGVTRMVPRGASATAQWRGAAYSVTRRVTLCDDHIRVADRIANTSDKLVGVIYENRLDLPAADPPKVFLAGRPPVSEDCADEAPGHPSAIVEWKDLAVGMFAEDDIFRIHVNSFKRANEIGLADPRLGIAPGESHTLEWSIYFAPRGDYWDIINAVRDDWGCNFTIPGPTLFDHSTDGTQSQDAFNRLVRSRQAKLVFSGQTGFKGDEIKTGIDLAEGPAIPLAHRWCAGAAEWVKKLHAADPAVKAMVYLHPSNCTELGAETKYADCKVLAQNGAHVTSPYHYPVYEYLSTLDNSYGKALFNTLEWIFKEINPDGIFMDEISGGSVPQYVYRAQWDGCTVVIDQKTHAVAGQCSSVILLEQSWKSAMVKYLRDRDKLLVGNGPASTRTMLGWQMPMLHELGSYSFLINMHLSSPIALGNHDNDNDDRVRARMVRRALDFAGVIYAYSWGDEPQGFHYMHVMFPLTPIALRPGMILGRERIITNRSGRYGWPDAGRRAGAASQAAEVHVFNADGQPVEKPNVKEVRDGGRLLTEVRMPGDHFAVLVRKGYDKN